MKVKHFLLLEITWITIVFRGIWSIGKGCGKGCG